MMKCKRSACTPECSYYHGNCPYEDEIPTNIQKLIDRARGMAYKLTKTLNDIYFESEKCGEMAHQEILDILAQGEE